MINVIGVAPSSDKYKAGTWEEFLSWIKHQREYQLDIETTMSEWWCDKKITLVQFGDLFDKVQWELQVSRLTANQWFQLRQILEDQSTTKLIHNATFEYVVFRFHGIIIDNVYDTMVAEKVILGRYQPKAIEAAVYRLVELALKYL